MMWLDGYTQIVPMMKKYFIHPQSVYICKFAILMNPGSKM